MITGEILQFDYTDTHVTMVIADPAGGSRAGIGAPGFILISITNEVVLKLATDEKNNLRDDLKNLIQMLKKAGVQGGEIGDDCIDFRYSISNLSMTTASNVVNVLNEILPMVSQFKQSQ